MRVSSLSLSAGWFYYYYYFLTVHPYPEGASPVSWGGGEVPLRWPRWGDDLFLSAAEQMGQLTVDGSLKPMKGGRWILRSMTSTSPLRRKLSFL